MESVISESHLFWMNMQVQPTNRSSMKFYLCEIVPLQIQSKTSSKINLGPWLINLTQVIEMD